MSVVVSKRTQARWQVLGSSERSKRALAVGAFALRQVLRSRGGRELAMLAGIVTVSVLVVGVEGVRPRPSDQVHVHTAAAAILGWRDFVR
jgi:hypothetical protein